MRQCNHLGPIAESYDELHSIPNLQRARLLLDLPPASYDSGAGTVFQAAEIALLNLARLSGRAAEHLTAGNLAHTDRCMFWIHGFQSVLRRLGTAAFTLQHFRAPLDLADATYLDISTSAGYSQYLHSLTDFERAVCKTLLGDGEELLKETLTRSGNDDALYRILHRFRVSAHDSTKWESDLHEIPVHGAKPALDELIGGRALAEAVAETELSAETFHGQFVALHQIPEVLCAEVNDHVEAAIRQLRERRLSQTIEHLSISRALLVPVVESQRIMVECLATSEYHEFRENLGPASGMHSLAIRQHMFRDLFKYLWEAVQAWLSSDGPSLSEAVRQRDAIRHDSAETWLAHTLLNETIALHNLHQEWRHEHLHMPRNCLGSGGTKSMIGVPDGPVAVMKMRDAANAQPSLAAVHEARGVTLSSVRADARLTSHHLDEASLDATIMRLVGVATREQFQDVQLQSYHPFRSGAPERRP